MSCVKVKEDFGRIVLRSSDTVVYQVGFFFDIPESITLPTYERGTPQRLPPSIRILQPLLHTMNENVQGRVAGCCDVTYHIKAQIFSDRRPIGSSSREIIVIPAAEIPPPIDPDHFSNEYRLVASSSIRPSWKSKSSMVVVSSTEPRPLMFQSNNGEGGRTEVVLNFKTRGMLDRSGEEFLIDPQLTECEVLISLEAVTYFLDHEQNSVMSVAAALQSSSVVLKKTRYKTERKKLLLGEWTKCREVAGKCPGNSSLGIVCA
jgi:hypothetical protein